MYKSKCTAFGLIEKQLREANNDNLQYLINLIALYKYNCIYNKDLFDKTWVPPYRFKFPLINISIFLIINSNHITLTLKNIL